APGSGPAELRQASEKSEAGSGMLVAPSSAAWWALAARWITTNEGGAEATMGILDFAKKQFIDILQWTESGDDLLAWRFPTADFEIQQGGQLIVRETQAALFVDQGHVADLFGPGTHTINT